MTRLPRRELALASVCAGLLMLEICLTKIFSIILWYHFGFLAVSTAMLGFAAAGVYLTRRGEQRTDASPDGPIAAAASIAAVVGVLSLWLITQTSFDVYTIIQDRTLGVLLAFILEVTLPFFFLGLVVSRTLAAFPERASTLYGADLIGSATGCGLAVMVLNEGLSGQKAILIATFLIGVGAVLFAGSQWRALLWAAGGIMVPIAALCVADVEKSFPLRSPKSKPYYRVESLETQVPDESSIPWVRGALTLKNGKVLEVETPRPQQLTADKKAMLLESDDGPIQLPLEDIAPRPNGQGLSFDVETWSPYRRWSSLSRIDAFHWPKAYEPWGLRGLSDLYRNEVKEPMPRQKGITIDAWAMTSIMRWSGKPLWPPGTPDVDAERRELAVLEYLPAGAVHRIRPAAPSVLCIGAGGGLDVLTAKYFGDAHVTGVEINPGVVDAVRKAFPDFAGHIYDPARHPDIDVQVAEGRHFLERSRERFDIVQLSGVDTFSTSEAGAFALAENYLYTVEAFRTYFAHLAPEGVLTLTRWFVPSMTTAPSGQSTLVPRYSLRLLALARRALTEKGVQDAGSCIFYLKSKGFTVILVKPGAFTRLEAKTLRDHCAHYGFDVLWSPYESTPTIAHDGKTYPNTFQAFMDDPNPNAFLAAQPFDVSPPRDDRPFYFEVSRFNHILRPDHYLNSLGGLTAHGTLTILFLEVLVLGLLFVILPLRRISLTEIFPGARRVRSGLLLYFTAIGFGFIVVEIVLTQKFVLYLGHPFYALAVILFSLLLFSGIGSLASSRWPLPHLATLFAGGFAIGAALLSDFVFHHTLYLGLNARIAISVLVLAPVGLAMGIPFPLGIRALAAVRPALIPWAWSINGYACVLGSVLAVILGIELGFMAVLFIAAAVYALGVVGYSLMSVRHRHGVEHAGDPVFDEVEELQPQR